MFQSFTMKLSEVSKLTDKLENKENVLQLIDIKIESDMKEVINKIDMLQNRSDSEFKRLEDKIGMVIWVLGILIALIVALKFFV